MQVSVGVDMTVDFSSSSVYSAPLGKASLGGRVGWLSARWTGMVVPPIDDYYTFRVTTAASPGLDHGIAACSFGSCNTTFLTLSAGASATSNAYNGADVWAMSLLAGASPCASNSTSADLFGAVGCGSLNFGLGNTASPVDGAYNGMHLYVSDFNAVNRIAVLQQRSIVNYSGISRTATLSSPLNPPPSPNCVYLLLPDEATVVSGLVSADATVPGQLTLSKTGAPSTDGAIIGLSAYIVQHDYSTGNSRPIQFAARVLAYQAANKTAWLDDNSVKTISNLTTYVIFGTPLGHSNAASYEPVRKLLTLTAPGIIAASSPPTLAVAATRYQDAFIIYISSGSALCQFEWFYQNLNNPPCTIYIEQVLHKRMQQSHPLIFEV